MLCSTAGLKWYAYQLLKMKEYCELKFFCRDRWRPQKRKNTSCCDDVVVHMCLFSLWREDSYHAAAISGGVASVRDAAPSFCLVTTISRSPPANSNHAVFASSQVPSLFFLFLLGTCLW